MLYIKSSFSLVVFLLASHVYSANPPSPNDPGLNLVMEQEALHIETDFSNPDAQGNSSLAAGQTATTCIEKGPSFQDRYRPRYADCAKALRRFPSGTESESFCNAPSAPCRLPAGASIGNCRITVDLLPSKNRETSSWAEIGLAATQLLAACVDGDKTAGTTLAGPNDGLQIVVAKVRY